MKAERPTNNWHNYGTFRDSVAICRVNDAASDREADANSIGWMHQAAQPGSYLPLLRHNSAAIPSRGNHFEDNDMARRGLSWRTMGILGGVVYDIARHSQGKLAHQSIIQKADHPISPRVTGIKLRVMLNPPSTGSETYSLFSRLQQPSHRFHRARKVARVAWRIRHHRSART